VAKIVGKPMLGCDGVEIARSVLHGVVVAEELGQECGPTPRVEEGVRDIELRGESIRLMCSS
jgi:hypothetical protein